MTDQDERWGTIEGTAAVWQDALRTGGYELTLRTQRDIRRIGRMARTWRQVVRITGIKPPSTVLEVGTGGGQQLLPFALKGYQCTGIDCSPEVIDRFRNTLTGLAALGRPVEVRTEVSVFPHFDPHQAYDMVIHCGLTHQILDSAARVAFHRRCLELCATTGAVAAVVSSGVHPRTKEVGAPHGFDSTTVTGLVGASAENASISPTDLRDELRAAGASKVVVYPVNLLGYRVVDPSAGRVRRDIEKLSHLSAQLIPRLPWEPLLKRSMAFVAIATP